MKRLLVPIDLGGSPTACALRPPPGSPPTPELVRAMIEHYLQERQPEGSVPVEVAFFRGGLPGDDLLEACRPWPVRVACSPADLDPEGARRLKRGGVGTIELEVLTFDTQVLRGCRRGYRGAMVISMLKGLVALGMERGVVLSPGLPGSSHQSAILDARLVAGLEAEPRLTEFARINPVLAFRGSELARQAAEGRWRPMHLGEAVTTTLEMDEILGQGGVEVIRMGLQPGQDIPHKVAAGPWHPNLRALVEGRRFRQRMQEALEARAPRRPAELRVNPRDLSWAKGTANENIRALRAALGLPELEVRPDESVPRGTVKVA